MQNNIHNHLKWYKDSVCQTIFSNGSDLAKIMSSTINKLGIYKSLDAAHWYKTLDAADWVSGRYCPTPTIVEAAKALYAGHSVKEISRSDAGDEDLHRTTEKLLGLINDARNNCKKAICFVCVLLRQFYKLQPERNPIFFLLR